MKPPTREAISIMSCLITSIVWFLFLLLVASSSTPVTLVAASTAGLLLSEATDPPCSFNALCTCSKPGPDLGKVVCYDTPLIVVPPAINSSAIYICVFKKNGLRKLEDRSFFGSGISSLEISHNLLSGSLGDNVFTGLERTLRELNLEANKLTTIPRSSLSRLQRLKQLNLNNNLITELRGEQDFPGNLRSSLRILSLAANSLTYIDQFAFKGLTALQHLDLSANNIFALNEMTFSQGNDFLSSSPLSATSLQSSIHQEENSYNDYRGFRGGGVGKTADSSSSPSSSFAPSLTQLESLNLANNRLKKIPFEAIHNLSSLKTLDLRSNLITATSDIIDYKGRRLSLQQLHLDLNR